MTIYRLTTYGTPAPKGSLKCIGARGPIKHQLIEDDKTGARKTWRNHLTTAAQGLADRLGEPLGQNGAAVAIGALFVLPRPKSATKRLLPTTRSGGDLDKFCRMACDALVDGGVIVDDSRIALLLSMKVYEVPTRQPGLVLYVTDESDPHERILRALLKSAPELREMNL